jgi:hypothetical protein
MRDHVNGNSTPPIQLCLLRRLHDDGSMAMHGVGPFWRIGNGKGESASSWLKSMPFQDRKVAMFYANGNGGQYIFVIPELDLVVVFTGENYDSSLSNLPFELMNDDILPSVH